MPEAIRGEFTIDLEKAREKLSQYQLADPYAYILEFVKAAVLRDPKKIEVRVDSDDIVLSFEGKAFDLRELENLELAVLDEANTARLRSRRNLAMGILAAQSLSPKVLRIRSSDGSTWLKKGDSPTSVTESTPSDCNEILVKMPWNFGVLLDVFRNRKDLRKEELLLRESCQYSRIHIIHNGEKISRDVKVGHSGLPCFAERKLKDERFVGSGAFIWGEKAELAIVVSGVSVQAEELKLGPLPFRARVEGYELSMDISGASVVKDEAYEALMKEVVRLREEAVSELAVEEFQSYAEEFRQELLVQGPELLSVGVGSYPGCLMLPSVWPLSDGRNCSFSHLVSLVETHGFLPYTVELFPGEPLKDFESILYCQRETLQKIESLTTWSTRNVTRRLRQVRESRQKERAWRSRPASVPRESEQSIHGRHIEGEGYRALLEIRDANSPPLLKVIVDGCLLSTSSPEEWPQGFRAIVSSRFTPLESFDGVHHDYFSVVVFAELMEHMRDLYLKLDGESDEARKAKGEYIRVASLERPLESLLKSCGVPVDVFRDEIGKRDWPGPNTEDESALLDVEWLRTDSGERLSLRDLQRGESKSKLVLSSAEKATIDRILGESFLETEESEEVAYRVDPSQMREERFLSAFRRELSLCTGSLELRLGGLNLSRVSLEERSPELVLSLSEDGLVLHRGHPLVKEALQAERDDVLASLLPFLISLVVSEVNRRSLILGDEQEDELHRLWAEHFLSSSSSSVLKPSGKPGGFLERIRSTGETRGWGNDPSGLGLRLFTERPRKGVEPIAVIPLGGGGTKEDFLYDLPSSVKHGERVEIHAFLVDPMNGNLVEVEGSPRFFRSIPDGPAQPIGRLIEVNDKGVCRGWCLDPNQPTSAVWLEFYLDGDWQEGEYLGGCHADLAETEFEIESGYAGDHGFEFLIPDSFRDGMRHTIACYAFDVEEETTNPLLEGSHLEFTFSKRFLEGDRAWLKGRQAMDEGHYQEAIQFLRDRLEQGGDHVPDDEVWAWLGTAFAALEDFEQSSQAYDKAIELAPGLAEHRYFSALLWERMGQEKRAVEALRKCIELEPEHWEAREKLSVLSSSVEEVFQSLTKLLELGRCSDRVSAYEFLFQYHLGRGDLEKATECYQKLEGLGSSKLEEFQQRLQESEVIGEENKPQAEMRESQEEERRIFEKCLALNSRGDYDQSLRLLKGLVQRELHSLPPSEVWLEVARSNAGLCRYKNAEKASRRALRFEPDSSEILVELGEALAFQGRDDECFQFFERALELAPSSPWVHFRVGAHHLRKGERKAALLKFRRVLDLDVEDHYQRLAAKVAELELYN